MRFSGRIALVTGASRGIGRATVMALAREGASVLIHYNRSEEQAESVRAQLLAESCNCLCVQADVSDAGQVHAMVEAAMERFGRIDILVNNAGMEREQPFEVKKASDWEETLRVNLIGPFLVAREVSGHMLEQRYGRIVNVASTSGLDSFSPMSMDYDASKAGLMTLTRNLAIQLQPHVLVNAVAPGWVRTDMTAKLDPAFVNEEKEKIYVKRFAEPEEIARTILFLASEDASFVNGAILKVDGGYH